MEKKILVLGGGFAGLAAAKRLESQSTARVLLLEASDYLGGRAKSALLSSGQKVELGATWLHGSEGHPVYQLAIEYGLMTPKDLKGTKFWKNSKNTRQGEDHFLNKEEGQLAAHAVSVFAETVDSAKGPGTTGFALRQKFQEAEKLTSLHPSASPRSDPRSGNSVGFKRAELPMQLHRRAEGGNREQEVLRDAWGWRELLQRGIDGSDCSDAASAAALAEYQDLEGPWGTVTGGYQGVAERMGAELREVRLETIVEKIRWGEEGVQVSCQGGAIFEADAAIVTFSLGVLKEHHKEMFEPQLPEAKAEAIAKLGMGVVDKIFVTFSPASEEQRSYELLWTCSAADLLPGGEAAEELSAIQRCILAVPSTRAWHRGVYSLRFGGSEFIKGSTQLQAEADSAEEAEERPAAEVGPKAVDGRLRKVQQGTAVAWIAGQHAADMELASKEELTAGLCHVLEAFPALKLPPTFQITRSTWGINPFSRGSYSYVPESATADTVDSLGEPIYAGQDPESHLVVCFAGEATSRKHIGTTTGAFLTGVQEADRLIQALGIAKT